MQKDFPIQIIYLHGFNSGFDVNNQKIVDLSSIVDSVVGYTVNYLDQSEVRQLEFQIAEHVASFDGETIVVGTSLGGYFARYFSAKFKIRAILINPATNPCESLMRVADTTITNYFTKLDYYVSADAVCRLSIYETPSIEDALMILATDDTIIPYEKSLALYGNFCKVVLTTGGHRLINLNNVIAEITAFTNRLPTSDKIL